MDNQRQRIVKKFKLLSDKYHNLSLLFYELSRSLNQELKPIENSRAKIKTYFKEKLNLDFEKIEQITKGFENISLSDLTKDRAK